MPPPAHRQADAAKRHVQPAGPDDRRRQGEHGTEPEALARAGVSDDGALKMHRIVAATDPGYAVPAMRATAQQLAELQAKARKARMDSGTAPKL